MIRFELGLDEPDAGPVLKSAATIGGAYVVEPGCPRGRTSPGSSGARQRRVRRERHDHSRRTPGKDRRIGPIKEDLADLSESQKETIALLKEKLDLDQRQVKSALEILGQANVPPERFAAKLVEIAEKFKHLQAAAAAQPGDDANITALKAEAQRAIQDGELGKAKSERS